MRTMKYRQLGTTSLKVSEICLGSMTWGEQNSEQEAHQQLNFALEKGVNFIDTAEVYPVPALGVKNVGRTEKYIGSWLVKNKKRKEIILATKVSGRSKIPYLREEMAGSPKETRLSAEHILYACEHSLRRLRTDYIDLYQLHWPERNTNFFGKLNYVHSENNDAIELQETLNRPQRSSEDRQGSPHRRV